jgi:hypothetical protein
MADEYCAGLWNSNMSSELLWVLDSDEKLAPRPREYQGPSWSWAAINGIVTFVPHEPLDSIDRQFSVMGIHIQPAEAVWINMKQSLELWSREELS